MIYLGKCSKYTWKECAFYWCWAEDYKNVNEIKLDDSVIQVFYIFTDFLL